MYVGLVIFFTIWYLNPNIEPWDDPCLHRGQPHTYCPHALKSGKVSINTGTITLSLKNNIIVKF